MYGFTSTAQNPESRLNDVEKTINEQRLINSNLLLTTNRQQNEIDQLKEQINTVANNVENGRMRERIDTDGTIEVGGISCSNARDILLYGMIFFFHLEVIYWIFDI